MFMIIDLFLPYDRKTWILSQVKPPILDVGCASGWIFKDTPFHPYTTYLDIDMRKLENFVMADAHNLPFRDNSFTTVVCAEVLEHVIDPVKVLSECVRVADFRVVITVPAEHLWDPKNKPFMKIEERLREEGLDPYELYKRDNPDALTSFAVDTGQAWHRRHYDDESIQKLLEPYKYILWRTHHPGGWVFYSAVIQV